MSQGTRGQAIRGLDPKALDALIKRLGPKDGRPTANAGAITPQPRKPGETFPLSFFQERLWFLDQLEPGLATYNVPGWVRLRGALDVDALSAAVRGVVERHEVLRTRFVELEGAPRQEIQTQVDVPMPSIDLSHLDTEAQHAEARRWALDDAQAPFDLAKGPLLRCRLLSLGPQQHILVLVLHHIVSDGWSCGIIVREMAALYEAALSGGESGLPELSVQYADYSVWQRQRLVGERLDSLLGHWRTELQGLEELVLPTDRPRPAIQRQHGARHAVHVPADAVGALDALARGQGTTLFVMLLATYQALLARWTGAEGGAVVSPVANRDRREIEGLVGFFVNLVVLRSRLRLGVGLQGACGQAADTVRKAFAHQELPFERLVQDLEPERSLGRAPLSQMMLALQNEPLELRMAELEMGLEELETHTSKLDLLLTLWPADDGLEGYWEYDSDLFDRTTIGRFSQQWLRLIDGAVADPDRPLGHLDLLSEGERRQVLVDWNDTRVDHPREATLHGLFERRAAAQGESIALVHQDARITYAELAHRVRLLAAELVACGVGPEARVAICMARTPRLLEAMLAVLTAGGAYVPLDPKHPESRHRMVLEDTSAVLLLTEERWLESLPVGDGGVEGVRVLCLDRTDGAGDAADSTLGQELPRVDAGQLAYVITTSGSTGRPKGVAIEHRSAVDLVAWARDHFPQEDLAGVLAATSVCFDLSIFELFVPLAWGGTVVLVDDTLALLDDGVGQAHRWPITLLNTVPSAMAALLDAGAIPSTVRTVNLAGEVLVRRLVDRIQAALPEGRVLNLYGPSEDTTYSTYVELERHIDRAPDIGRPLDNTAAYLLDHNLLPVGVGVRGEIVLGGDSLARGYLDRPALTAERFIPDPYGGDSGARLYRTGDLGRWRRHGRLEFHGRRDHQVKLRGHRIELGEIEAALEGLAGIRGAAVIVDGGSEGRLAAFVEGSAFDPAALRRASSARLPHYMVPAIFVHLDPLPRTATGKIDRRSLPEAPKGQRDREHGPLPPRDAREATLADVWKEVLGLDTISVDDDFFELGGHSLLAVRVRARLRQEAGFDVPIRWFFETPILEELAARLATLDVGSTAAQVIAPLADRDALPLSFSQERLWFLDRLDPGLAVYNMPIALRLEGALRLDPLREAWGQMLERHEVLRYRFASSVEGLPKVTVEPSGIPLDIVEVTPPGSLERALGLVHEEASRPFDLATESPIRGRLLQLESSDHVLVVVMHHIVSDGLSLGVFARELAELYGAFSGGRSNPLPPLPIQFGDFAAWQREHAVSSTEGLEFWRQHLEGLEPLELPKDHPRPAHQDLRGATHPWRLSRDLTERLRAVGREGDATLFMVLLAAWQLLLGRLSGVHDIAVGSPVAGRGPRATEGLVGFFVNTVVLRTDLGGLRNFQQLLARVRTTCMESFAHQDVPFERLVEVLRPERDPSHSPIFQVMLALQEDVASPELEGLVCTPLPASTGGSRVDLSLSVLAHRGGLDLTFEYARALFEPATVDRWARAFERLLSGLAAYPGRSLLDLPLLGPSEELQILTMGRGETPAGRPDGFPGLHQRIFARALEAPEAWALRHGDDRVTYGQMMTAALRLADHLRALGVGQETPVGVYLHRSPELVISFLGVLAAGGYYVPLDPDQPPRRLAMQAAILAPKVVVTMPDLAATAPEVGAGRLLFDEATSDAGPAAPTEATSASVEPSRLAYVIFTSGSTGEPKAVAVTHGGIVNLAEDLERRFATPPGAVALAYAAPSFDASVFEWVHALTAGAELCIADPKRVPPGRELAAFLRREGVHWALLPPAALGATPAQDLPDLGLVASAGEALPGDHVDHWAPGRTMWNLYGPTEVSIMASGATVRGGEDVPPIGRAVDGTHVVVADAGLHPVPEGVPGELLVGGQGVARGYLGRPAETALRFIPDPFAQRPGSRLYRTGDRVRWRRDELVFLGRSDDQIKLRGFRIEPGEIETVLGHHPKVSACAVVFDSDTSEPRLVAYHVPSDAGRATDSELRESLGESLPPYMVPALFVPLDRLPLTVSGKVDRKALPRAAQLGPLSEVEFVAPRTAEEQVLTALFSEILGVERVGIDDDFFALGGHSLLATQVVARMNRQMSLEIPVRALFDAATPRRLGQWLVEHREGTTSGVGLPLEAGSLAGDLELSAAQQRLWFLDQLAPGSPLYNIPMAFGLEGHLDLAALAAAVDRIFERHTILRSTFQSVDGQPRQRIRDLGAAPAAGRIPLVDLSHLESHRAESEARRLERFEARQPFDLGADDLLRLRVLRLAPQDHRGVVTMHHIASDGWSMGVFVRELVACYQAAVEGRTPDVPPMDLQYADYARWQKLWLDEGRLEAQSKYWRQQLADLQTLELPTDRPRPGLQSLDGAVLPMALDADLGQKLDALARTRGVSPFMVLLATFQAVLGRWAGQQDVVLGSPVANRPKPELESLIGFFVNMLVLRSQLGTSSFEDLLDAVRTTTLDAYAHQDVSFEQLVDELQPRRDLSRHPLFQVVLILQNTPAAPVRIPDLKFVPRAVDSGTARFDLTWTLEPQADGEYRGGFEYATQLFDAATIERLGGHLRTFLRAAVEAPDRSVDHLPLLDTAERQQLIHGWNDTALEIDTGARLDGLFSACAARHAERRALVFGDEVLTYAELAGRVTDLAGLLRSRSLGPGDVVGLALERSVDMVVALLAVLESGAAYLPIDPEYPRQRLQWILADAGAALVLTRTPETAEWVGDAAPVLRLDSDDWRSAQPAAGDGEQRLRSSTDLAYLIFTSGSTGRPKGVMVEHRQVVNFLAAMDQRLGVDDGDGGVPVMLAMTSMSFDISVLELLWSLTRGFQVVLQGEGVAERLAASEASATRPAGPTRPIDFSLFYFADEAAAESTGSGSSNRYRLLLEGARWADSAGLSAVWTPERHFHSFGGLYPNPAVAGAAIAAITEHIQIRAGSVVLPLHNPLRVAEEWSVVDNISGGRVGVSFASGWHKDDFALAPQPEIYDRRHAVMAESITTVRELWRGEAVEVINGGGDTVSVRIHPPPVQPELPFWVTAAGNPATFEHAGALGANLLTHLLTQSLDELAEKIVLYRRAWDEAGHSGRGHVTVMLHTFVDGDRQRAREVVRAPFRAYLASSIDLLRPMARAAGIDLDAASTEDIDVLLDHAFDRFYDAAALFGDTEGCLARVGELAAAGIDEIGCLIDFGVATDDVLSSFEFLGSLVQQSRDSVEAAASDDTEAVDPADDRSVAAEIRRHGVTHLQCTPSMARLLAADPKTRGALKDLRVILLGGEALPSDLAEDLVADGSFELHNMYGPTETTVWSTSHRVKGGERPLPIGTPIANTQVHITDRHLRLQPVGVPGELLIGGQGVVRGYHERPALTAERFVPDPLASTPGARLYRTGDLVRRDTGGNLLFMGRIDHQVKIGGHRIELGEIESRLVEHPAVAKAAVTVRGESGAQQLVAYAVPTEEARAATQDSDLFRLPDGRRIAHLSKFQASVAWRELFEDDIYLAHGLELPAGSVIFDVGANMGMFTLFAASRCPDARIYSFEPIPPTFEVLSRNASMHVPGAKVFNCGLADHAHRDTFTFYPQMSGLSGRYAVPDDTEAARAVIRGGLADGGQQVSEEELDRLVALEMESESHECELRTVSEIIDAEGIEQIDYLKVDVERSEVDVLRGIRDEHWPRIAQLGLEVDGTDHLEIIRPLLEAKGYTVWVDDFITAPTAEGSGVETLRVYMVYARRPDMALAAASDSGRGSAGPAAQGTDAPAAQGAAADGGLDLEATPTALREFLHQRLPISMVPSAVVLLDDLPLTPNGKIDRRRLPDPEVARPDLDSNYVAPQRDTERAIAAVWSEVLGVERVGLDDNFFELGGTSLMVVQLRSRLEETLGREISLVDLFRHPTVRALDTHWRATAASPGAGAEDSEAKLQGAADRGQKKRDALKRKRPPRRRRPSRG